MSRSHHTLRDVIALQRGYDLTEALRHPGDVPVIGSAGIHGYHNESRAKGPGITLGRSGGSFGKVTFILKDFWPHNTTIFVTDFKGNKPLFIRYLLSTLDFSSLNSGSAQQSLNRNYVYGVHVRKFSQNEQLRIAAVLSAYDDLVESNRRSIALLEKLAAEIHREWFVRLRFPGHEKVKAVKGVPIGWEVRPLASFASEMKRVINKRNLADDENYVGLEHLPRRSIAIQEWTTADTVDSNKLMFQERDILFSKIRPYLHKVALAHFSGACSSDTIVIRPKEKLYEGYLLFTVFSDTFIELATVASKGTKMPRADWGFLKKLELAVPNKKLLELYQEQFEPLFSRIVSLLRANELLATSRDLLLPRLISGKLPVQNRHIQFPPSMAEELNAEATNTAHA